MPIVVFIGVALCLLIVWIVIQMNTERPDSRPASFAGKVVFIGSSTIARFPVEESFPPARAANLGKPDENAVDMRARIARDLPDDAAPAGFVLYAGSYDLRFKPGLSVEEIRDRVDGVVGDLRGRFPQVPIALIQVLPARAQSPEERSTLAALNAALETVVLGRGASLLRTNRPPLTDANGDLLESMSTDRFHLNAAGYDVLARWIREDGGAVGALLR